MKIFVPALLLILSHLGVATAQPVKPTIDDKFQPGEPQKINGYVGGKLDQSYQNRVFSQNVDELIEPFRHRNESRLWQTEFWGKWFTSAVLAYRYHPQPGMMKVLQSAVKGLIATQTPDGYIGNYSVDHRLEQWDIWGRKYCLLGLLDFYELTQDQSSLDAAVRLADHLILEIKNTDGKIINKGNYRGMAASSVLEPIVKLYRLSGNKKYLDFGKEIVRQWETPEGPNLISKANVDVAKRFPKPQSWYSPEQGQKAYEMMSCYEGLLELYRVTGDERYKTAVEKTWQNIRDTEIDIAGSGASEEMWFGGKQLQATPVAHFQEVCVTVTWIKLSQQLLRLTGETKYADAIEQAYYNALLGSINADASVWAKYTPLNGERLPGSGQCGMNLNCCEASGPRGQFTLPFSTVMSTREGVAVNFFVDGAYQVTTPGGRKLIVHQRTDYPASGEVDLSMEGSSNEEFVLQVRIPAWSALNKVVVNNEEIGGVVPGEWLKIKRKWSSKDVVSITFDMRGRMVTVGEKQKASAIVRGPVVLARDARLGGPSLATINTPVADKSGYVALKPVDPIAGDECWMRYSATFLPEAYTETGPRAIQITLCDYASAGNGKERSVFEVWLARLYSGRTE